MNPHLLLILTVLAAVWMGMSAFKNRHMGTKAIIAAGLTAALVIIALIRLLGVSA